MTGTGLPSPRDKPVRFLRWLYDAAVDRARPAAVIADFLPDPPRGRTIVVGAGKSAAAMAAAFEDNWPGPVEGVVVTRYGHAGPTRSIRVLEAGHPVPDRAGIAASREILAAVESAGPDDLVVALISGGGSALLVAPLPGLSFETKQAVSLALLHSGASIDEINCVRKHFSAVKGGRLLRAAAPARLVTLAISDVVGDDPAVIASGPTVPDTATQAEARAVLDKYAIGVPAEGRRILEDPQFESPDRDDFLTDAVDYRLIASPAQSLAAAAGAARDAGTGVIDLGDGIEGEAARYGAELAARALEIGASGVDTPLVILSGGELTVTVNNPAGKGGPSTECALGFVLASKGQPGVFALFADTDGIDGTGDNAGAIVTPTLHETAEIEALDGAELLARNRSYDFFDATGGLLVTGPSRTNVNDFRAVLLL